MAVATSHGPWPWAMGHGPWPSPWAYRQTNDHVPALKALFWGRYSGPGAVVSIPELTEMIESRTEATINAKRFEHRFGALLFP
jgi:hypothetical protein